MGNTTHFMSRRHLQLLTPLILLAYLLAQNGLVLAQIMAGLSGHQVSSSWHDSHYDVVMTHGGKAAPIMAEDGCQVSCSDHHHMDLKPAEPARADAKSKSLLGLLVGLLPLLLVGMLPLMRRQMLRHWPPLLHRNSLPLLIRSTVLRH